MTLRAQRRAVRAAQAEVAARRSALAAPAAALVARTRERPLTSLGVVAGIGFVFGNLRWPLPRTFTASTLVRDGVLELAVLLWRTATAQHTDAGAADSTTE